MNAERWFLEGAAIDPDALGGQTRRTRIIDGACVFLNRPERGCLLHAYALQHGLSVNAMKPLYCRLFPLVVDHGQLEPESVAKDRSLICLGAGATLYQGQREELRALMGDDFVAEVDALEQQVLSVAPSDATGPTSGKRGKSLALVCNR